MSSALGQLVAVWSEAADVIPAKRFPAESEERFQYVWNAKQLKYFN